MSRAFVKEPDGSEPPEAPPERPLGPHRNLVTARGLALIEAEIARLRAALPGAGKEDALRIARDLRYWEARRASAEPVPVSAVDTVRFGHAVTLLFPGGARRRYRIVGLDEADPAAGLLSYASPIAGALLGRQEGDEVEIGRETAEILSISV